MIAACTTPTAWVLVMPTGPQNVPDSSIHDTPVISPLPFCAKNPAATGSPVPAGPRGWIAVTPVRTLSPEISVRYPTCTPGTSVMAFAAPVRPRRGMPRSLARGPLIRLLVHQEAEIHAAVARVQPARCHGL